jgi:hypothetical protein
MRSRFAWTLAALAGLSSGLAALAGSNRMSMPGESYRGPLAPLNAEEALLADKLRAHIEKLAGEIGPREVGRPHALAEAAAYIEERLRAGGHAVRRQEYEVDGVACANLEVELRGGDRADEVVVIGGHYDTAGSTPGANDNASGVAAALELARLFAGRRLLRTLRFVAFVNEEPPYFQTAAMGSFVYARACRERGDKVVAMLSLETMGYYSDEAGSQQYPAPFGWFYPSTGDFVAFVGNWSSRALVRQAVGSFRRHARFPSEGGALPGAITGVGWSDHWAFWKCGYPALMVTDTALFRYPYYHHPADTPDKVDCERLARVVWGLAKVIEELAGA